MQLRECLHLIRTLTLTREGESGFAVTLFRDIVDARGRIARWVQSLKGKSGVYVIRKKALLFPQVVYVGESHTGHLKKTLLRHFQKWDGKTSGPTYDRAKVEVAAFATSPSEAVEKQNAYIRHFNPEDNTLGKEANPF